MIDCVHWWKQISDERKIPELVPIIPFEHTSSGT